MRITQCKIPDLDVYLYIPKSRAAGSAAVMKYLAANGR